MIVDTSAVMAILLGESDAEEFATAIARAPRPRMSAGNHIELVVTATRRAAPIAWTHVTGVLEELRLGIEPVTADQVVVARTAFLAYGRGQHEAGLNFGDCFAYSLAKLTDEPLLYKGSDFSRTDVRRAR